MASSLIGGMIEKGFPASSITASEPLAENRQSLANRFGIQTTADNLQAAKNSAVVVLAVKPQIMKSVAVELQPVLTHNPVIISIAAGINIASLQRWLGDELPIVRCMPNTPALVQTGASALFANANMTPAQRQLCDEILSAVGLVEWVPNETDIDTATAVSGSGPAYYFLVMEMMEKIAVEMGLTPKTARALTLQTALGAAKMASTSDLDCSELRRRVTSPKGTTERAVQTFLNGDIEGLFRKAMADCRNRAVEMANEFAEN